MNPTESYNTDSIKVLSDIQHLRLRPGMYIGDTNDPRQLFSEAFDNALDEAQSGYSELTTVYIDTKSRVYTVIDNGRGIPIGLKLDASSNKYMETLEILCTRSFSGGKFDNNSYKVSSGVHGVGLCCINALSDRFILSTHRDHKSRVLTCSKGNKVSLECNDDTDELGSGTAVTFRADKSIFDTDEIPLDFIRNRCLIAKAFGYDINLIIDNKKEVLPAETLSDLIPSDNDESLYTTYSVESKLDNGEFMKVIIKYVSRTDAKYYGYTNLLYNRYGGTHIRLINKAIESVWSEFYPKDTNLRDSDCTAGLRCLCAVFINNIAFSSQTKDKLTTKSSEIEPLISKFKEDFRNQLQSNPEMTKALLNRFQEYRNSQIRLSARKEIMELVKLNGRSKDTGKVHRKSVVRGLIECTSPNLEGTELYIVEGNSASGTVARARNKKLQAVLPLRGKIKNITYKSISSALKYDTVIKIINAIGAGVGNETDPDRCRYDKIIISTDSDADGYNIAALLMSVFINLTPNLVKSGRVYLLQPPLYGWIDKKLGYQFVDDVSEIPKNILESRQFTRYKGLGEMDDDEYKQSCMIPGQRRLYKIQYPSNLDEFNRILGTTSGRRELLKDLGLIRYIDTNEECIDEDD